MAKSGICHICGANGKLSFEHVPPRAAFNKQRILRTDFEKIIGRENLDKLPGQYQQKGAGAYTLCEKCNNDTGTWYGDAYAHWAHQAMRTVIGTGGQPSLAYPFNLYPLRVLKQVVCMFFSVSSPLFQCHQPDLVRFVLNRDQRAFPSHVRVYAFYTFWDRSRAVGPTGVLRGLDTGSPSAHVFSEVTFPPFGFVMTLGDTPTPESTFLDISGFSQFEYRDWRIGISMKLPLLSIYTPFPGDYRPRAQALADAAESKRWMARHRFPD